MTVIIEQGPIKVVSMGGVVLGKSEEEDIKIMKAQKKFYEKYEPYVRDLLGWAFDD